MLLYVFVPWELQVVKEFLHLSSTSVTLVTHQSHAHSAWSALSGSSSSRSGGGNQRWSWDLTSDPEPRTLRHPSRTREVKDAFFWVYSGWSNLTFMLIFQPARCCLSRMVTPQGLAGFDKQSRVQMTLTGPHVSSKKEHGKADLPHWPTRSWISTG